MAKLKDTEINGNLAVNGDESVNGHLEVEGQGRFNETLIVNGSTVDVLKLTRIGSTNASTIGFGNDNGMLGYVGMTDGADGGLKRWLADLSQSYTILDSNNVGNYALPIAGGKVTGNTIFEGELSIRGTLWNNSGGWLGAIRSYNDYIEIYNEYGGNRKGWIGFAKEDNFYMYNDTNGAIVLGAGSTRPYHNASSTLGTSSYRWTTIHSVNALNTSSDRNLKKNINPLNDKYEALFNELKPVSFERTFANSDRVHVGFISQDVEESLENVGLTAKDFAGFGKDIKQEKNEKGEFVDVLDENGNPIYEYSLRYEEFIALNTHMIQKQQKEIESLKEENNKLKEDFNTLKEEIKILKNLYKQSSN